MGEQLCLLQSRTELGICLLPNSNVSTITETVDIDMAEYKEKVMWPFPWRSLAFGSPLSMTNMHNCEPPAASVFQRTRENEEMITYTFKPSFHLFVFIWERFHRMSAMEVY